MVSTTSALEGHGEIAYGNAIGSIICNSALIAALTIAVRPGVVDPKTLRTPVYFFFTVALFYAGVAYTTGNFSRMVGIILLLAFAVYMLVTVRQIKKSASAPVKAGGTRAVDSATGKDIGLLVIGAVLIAIGAKLLVDNGILIAEGLGVPESVIALTFIALGTSLPELVTAVTSLVKGHGSLSLGNIVGANLFNLVLVSGVSVALAPFRVPESAVIGGINASLVLDIPVMFLVMVMLTIPALARGKQTRAQGIMMLLVYAAFCAVQFSL